MNRPLTVAVAGCGSRGQDTYSKILTGMPEKAKIVAAADIDPEKLAGMRKLAGIDESACYASAEDMLKQPKLADIMLICTPDRCHYAEAKAALLKDYDLLLEKPISPVPEETLALEEKARETERRVVVCHVLRYSPFFREIKKQLDAGAVGRIVTVQHNENIGNFHFAHSFVRGNWRRSDTASPLIMQKSCHDMDLLVWLIGSGCRQVASFGSLTCFKPENAPKGAAERCADCPCQDTCRYNAYKAYLPVMGSWPAAVLTENQTEEGLREAIQTGPYGRCVFRCDNNVCDHQVTALEFENGVTATFNLSAFTNRIARTLKIMGEDGELRANEYTNEIEITRFASNGVDRCESCVIRPDLTSTGHGGGDGGIMEDFLALLEGRQAEASSEIRYSVESHMMACAAEEARLTGAVVNIADFRRRHGKREGA